MQLFNNILLSLADILYCLNILLLSDREIFLENYVNTLEKELDICRGRFLDVH